ncbi:CASP9 [Bugula neritina]|uniref:CASP9 n=1 Tax=Bugula neritina TaxID=10212 RepID=A0A7J7K6V6_BUGNE|nr:CASP9 [Bugula neritina]
MQMSAVDEGLYLMPPGPDYLLLSVKYSKGYTRKQTPDMKSYKSIQHLIVTLSCNPNVQKIDVNSTLNKRFVREENEFLADDTKFLTDTQTLVAIEPASQVVQNPAYDEANIDAEKEITRKIEREMATYASKENKGKALIICNNLGLSDNPTDSEKVISQLRKEALAHAQKIFTNHLGFWVEVKQDLSAEEMLSSISQFSKSEGHESLTVLVVFSHGKGGMIYGHNGVSKCSTQEVVNTFNSGQVTAIPKLLFLSCCRGDISAIYNRAPHSFESSNEFPWPENEIELLYKPTKRVLPDTEREEEWERLTFQPLDLPADCYVCFTTLPDSRSKAGKFFKYFSDYLSQLTNSGPYQPTVSIDDIINDDTEPPMEVCSEYRHRLLLLEGASPSVQRVELVDLLTDAAGVMREKFQSKQYFNLCYSVNRDSKQVFIDVLPSCS